MREKMVAIGNNVFVSTGRIVCIMPIISASKALMARAQMHESLIDASGKKKKSSIILANDGTVFVSHTLPETIRKRVDQSLGDTCK